MKADKILDEVKEYLKEKVKYYTLSTGYLCDEGSSYREMLNFIKKLEGTKTNRTKKNGYN